MTSETSLPAPKRLSLPLSAQDIKALNLIRGSAQHLSALPGKVSENASEAELVHAIFEAGLARVREAIELAGYLELSNDEEYTNHRTQRRAAAGQRRSE
jgi:hypothetical protein